MVDTGDTIPEDKRNHVDSGDYTYEPMGEVNGWTCSKCKGWVPDGHTHICPMRPESTAAADDWDHGSVQVVISEPTPAPELATMLMPENQHRIITYEHERVIELLESINEGMEKLLRYLGFRVMEGRPQVYIESPATPEDWDEWREAFRPRLADLDLPTRVYNALLRFGILRMGKSPFDYSPQYHAIFQDQLTGEPIPFDDWVWKVATDIDFANRATYFRNIGTKGALDLHHAAKLYIRNL